MLANREPRHDTARPTADVPCTNGVVSVTSGTPSIEAWFLGCVVCCSPSPEIEKLNPRDVLADNRLRRRAAAEPVT